MAFCTAAVAGLGAAVTVPRMAARWGATRGEAARALPGDDQVPRPQIASTRAISIDAPPTAVWPWLVQMGWRRAGWYSYDAIDNGHASSAQRIIPELQHLQVGDLVPEGALVGWTVEALEPDRLLLLTAHAPMAGVAWVRRRDSSWLFLLEATGSEGTRLIERSRTTITMNEHALLGKLLANRLGSVLLALGDFAMARRQLQGIRRRAERHWREQVEPASSRRGWRGGGAARNREPRPSAAGPDSRAAG